MKYIFVSFLLFSATMLFSPKIKGRYEYKRWWVLVLLGGFVGILSGLLGVGGGAILMPVLILLGYDPKKMAIAISFVLSFSTFAAFLTYLSLVHMDWALLILAAVGASTGGYVGNRIMYYRLSSKHIRIIISIMLYLIAARMLFALLS